MSRRPALSALHKDVTTSYVVHIRNLPVEVTDEKLKELFSYCKVTQVDRETFHSGRAQKSAFVRFASPDEARRALAMNGRKLMGRKLELCLVPEDYANRLLEGDLLNLASYAEKGPRIGTRKASATMQHATKAAGTQDGATNFRVVTEQDLEEALQASEGQHRVVAEGLPFSSAQIKNFLWPTKPSRVVRVRRTDGALSRKVVLTFASLDDAQEAAKKNGHVFFGRSIRIKLLTCGASSGEGDNVTANAAAASSPSSS
uniref:Putative splicing factor hnrnp-f n=1 Tax=Amblyomma triste TaxID=251400 RepID=A0A023G3Y0_AMBTT